MNTETFKSQSKTFGVHTIITYVTLLPILWFIGKPLLSDALASDIQEIVAEQNQPLIGAFQVLLSSDIGHVRKEIAALRFRQRQNGSDWAVEDAEHLESLQMNLEALKEAREKLKNETG